MIAIKNFPVRNAVSRQLASLSQAMSAFITPSGTTTDGSQDRIAVRQIDLRKTSLADDAGKTELLCGRANYARGIIMSH